MVRRGGFVVALDIGTTSIRAVCFNEQLRPVAQAQQEIRQYYPQPGWVEQDPHELWQVAKTVLDRVIGSRKTRIVGIGMTNQRETTVVWDQRNGKAVHNAISWQCRRTAQRCDALKKRGIEKRIRTKTGLRADPYFSATKAEWILQRTHTPKQHLLFGTVDTWVLWNMTRGAVHATDQSNASRTMLYNIRTKQWDKPLCTLFGVPSHMLPRVLPSRADFGTYNGIPILAVVGDQQSALFGHGAWGGWKRGTTKVTYGTGCFLLQHIGPKFVQSRSQLLTTLTPNATGENDYALEGSVFMGGAIMQWLRDGIGILPNIAQSAAIAHSVADTHGATIVPAFTGLGAPYWNADTRGIITGLTRGVTWKHLVRAATESIAFQVNDVLHAMQADTKKRLATVVVDGGATRDDFLLQFQADISRVQVARARQQEATALGAAMLAGLQAGLWKNPADLATLQQPGTLFNPKMTAPQQKNTLQRWQNAVAQALHTPA